MKLLCYTLITFLLLKGITTPVFAQSAKSPIDSLEEKIAWLGLQKPSTLLFVHFDKTIYSNNENVWFTGYILKNNIKGVHHTLAVALVRNDDRSVLSQGKFVIDDGLAFGNIFLPDSLPTGNYSFVCYTNQLINGDPAALFVQPVTIKSNDTKGFIANLSLTDSIKPGMDSATVLLKAYTKDISLVKAGAVKYFIGDRAHPLHVGNLKTDNFGEVKITIPLKEITPANNILQAEINNGKEIKNFSIRLPVYKKETIVKFYPEGGHLVDSAINTVGWEVTNNEGEPLMVNASLYQNDQVVQTITTNVYGMGKFFITPQKDSRYYVKLITPKDDKEYALPPSLQIGISITVSSALTSDTLYINANNKADANKLLLLVHDYHSVFISAPINTITKTTLVKIPLTEVPKGIVTLTVLDSLGRPVAERLFFAHFDKKATVSINTDSAQYNLRQKVTTTFKITDANHKPLIGLVSVACVQNNRLELKKTQDIESYTYLTDVLTAFPFKRNVLGNDADNKIFLEQLLLIKGWRKYKWQDVEMVTAKDTMPVIDSLTFAGKVTIKNKPLKKPVLLNLKKYVTTKMSMLEFINTDSLGNFIVVPSKIINEPNKKIEVSVRNDHQEDYTIKVNDPYKEMNKKLAASLIFTDYTPRSFAQSSQAFILKADEVAKTLATVVVASKKDNRMYTERIPGTNACGDYVCQYNILNCTNHFNEGFQPVVGRTYGNRSPGSPIVYQAVYMGCSALNQDRKNEYLFSMEGIYAAKEFYVTDLTKADITDPQYLSTIYWKHAVITDKNGMAQVSFYTSDIPGKFRIVIQGIVTNDVLYGEQFFEVKEQ